MRSTLRLTLLWAAAVLAMPVASASADGGAAACTGPVTVDRAQQVGGLSIERGPQRLTILDSSQMSCEEAGEEFEAILRAPGGDLPEGWTVDAASGTFESADGTEGFRVQPQDAAETAASTSTWDQIEDWAVIWLPIIFMGLIAVVLVMTLRYLPRTKPQEIKPSSSSSVRWEDVAGADEAKDELREVVEFLRDPKRFRKLGAKVPKGILLHGPPGTGKTLLAKAAANEAEAKFFAQSASSFVEMFAGLGAARIRRLFRHARKEAPAIVFIDELDAVGATRGKDISGEKDQTLNQLLVELDGFGSADNVVVIAASNLLEKLDPALLRPGRFDRQILVTAPDLKGRRAILEVHTRNKPLEPGIDLELIARQTSNLTGADLANICNEAAIFAGRDHRETIRTKDFPVRARARDRGHAVTARDHRAREARGRLPRGWARALLGAAAVGGEGPPHLDHSARAGARLHAQPARGGPLPQDEGRAARLHGRPARRSGHRAHRLRPRSRPAPRTTCARCTRSAAR